MNTSELYILIMQNMDIAGWFIAAIVFLIVEIMTLGLTTIWFMGGALAALILAALGCHIAIQIAAFLIVTIVLLVFTRPIAVKHFNAKVEQTNVNAMIGRKVRVTKTIDNTAGEGKVIVGDVEWTARSEADDVIIPEGSVVSVIRVEGVKVIVKSKKED